MRVVFHALGPMLIAAVAALAQEPAAPTPAPTGSTRGQNLDGYNIVNQFELGCRFHTVGGDPGRYRSDINYGNGIRLLGSSLTVHSREGRGAYFDELALTTQGLGDDPYQSAGFRIQKNRLYRYDLLWRSTAYYNPALSVSLGQHLLDTERRLQDHDFILFPQSSVRFFAGYSRNSQQGPALTTVQQFGPRNDEFPLFADIDRLRKEYRLGGEVLAAGWRFNWLRGWDNYAEDLPARLGPAPQGNDPADLVTLTAFRRTEPYRGSSPYWRLALLGERRHWSANARLSYTSGRRDFLFGESASGTSRFGAAQDRQIVVAGEARRPVAGSHLTLSFFPVNRLTLTNHTSYHHVRMEGDATYREINNAATFGDLIYFRFLGIRTIANLTDASYRASGWLGLRAGYSFSSRRIRSREQLTAGDIPELAPAEQENRLHQGSAGIRMAAARRLQINLDGEIGRADRPFFPTADRKYHTLSARLQYRTRTLSFGAQTRAFYNTNSTSLFAHSSRSRNHAFDASWSPAAWFGADAGYSRIHLDTATGIAYFAAASLVDRDRSISMSSIHAAHAGVRFSLRGRADVWVGYHRTQDAADAGAGTASVEALRAAQVFPLTFESPVGRLSVKLHDKVRWNFGYQHYRYKEEFDFRRSYRAHTGYTSVLWSF